MLKNYLILILKFYQHLMPFFLKYLIHFLFLYLLRFLIRYANRQDYILFLHNLPIYIRQNPIIAGIRLIFHNIPILIKQTIDRFLPGNDEPVSYDYRKISKVEAAELNSSWLDDRLPDRQWKVVSSLMAGGEIPQAARLVIKLIRGLGRKKIKLLDVGCSSGFYYDFFTSAGLDVEYQGCDFAPKFIKLAQSLHPLVKFRVCNLTSLEYQSNSFNVVLVSGSLHYVIDYKLAFFTNYGKPIFS